MTATDDLFAGAKRLLPPDEEPYPWGEQPDDEPCDDMPQDPMAKPVEGAQDPQGCAELVDGALELFQRRNTGEEQPIPSPWRCYNDLLGGGLWPGCHVLIGGTGIGKTQFALQIGLTAARAGVPVTMVALELDREQLMARLIGEIARLSWSKLYLGRYTEGERERAERAAVELRSLPFFVEHAPPMGWCTDRLRGIALFHSRKLPSKRGGLIILDFLQLVSSKRGERVELRERIGRAAYEARSVAREHGATVLLVSSVARHGYKILSDPKEAGIAPKGKLMMPDLLVGLGKESGEVEFSADSVTTLVRGQTIDGETEVYACVPKLRTGRKGWCGFRFRYRFDECLDLEAPERATGKKPSTAKSPAAETRHGDEKPKF